MRAATKQDVEEAIAQGRLRVDLTRGIPEYRLPHARAMWRECPPEVVTAPHCPRGYHRNRSLFNAAEVAAMRRDRAAGLSLGELRAKYGRTDNSTISKIVRGVTYKRV